MGPHVYGSPGPPKSDIPGEEASTIGVRFCMLPNGEVHVSEVSLPAILRAMLAARCLSAQTTQGLTLD